MRTLVFFLLFGGCVLAQNPAEEIKRFDGKWQVLLATKRGETQDDAHLKKMTVTFKDGSMIIQDGTIEEKAKFTIDPTTKPASIFIESEKGSSKASGIYQFELLTLKLAWSLSGEEKPTKFSEKPEATVTSLTLQRVKE
jgi:uncharacterized protein (TIGR03067 family)